MEGVEFEETKYQTNTARKIAFLPRLVMKYSRGKIETEMQANFVLVVSAVIIFLMAVFMGTSDGVNTRDMVLDPAAQAEMERLTRMKKQ